MKTYPCYQCGYCCTVSPCAYGKWSHEKQACALLTSEGKCLIYDDIVEKEKNSPFPMMGCGCSSPLLNEVRAKKMRELGLNPEKEQADINSDFELDFGEGFDKLFSAITEETI